MKFQILCKKSNVNNLWVFDYTFSNNELVIDEPLMHQATDLIDKIVALKGYDLNDNIVITFSNSITDQSGLASDIVLTYEYPSLDGSMYKVTDFPLDPEIDLLKEELEVWLCPVLFQFYDKQPVNLYVNITKQFSKI